MSIKNIKPVLPYPALLIEDDPEKILVISDLHIGWEIDLIDKGIYIPSQVTRVQTKLFNIIEKIDPTQIIILGDVKQSIPKISSEEWRSVPYFFENIQKVTNNLSVILGNHDGDITPLIPPTVKILSARGLVVGKKTRIGLFHGHAWPSPEILSSSNVLIMGHIHPVVLFRDKIGLWMVRQVWVKAKCDGNKLAAAYLKYLNVKANKNANKVLKEKLGVKISDKELIIMPAFNDLIGGLPINRLERRLMGPILRSRGVNVESAEAYLLDGTYIGVIKQLRNYLVNE